MAASPAWDLDLPSVFAFALPGIVVPFVCLILAFRRPTAAQLERWANLCGISLDPSGARIARRHLGRVRRFRSIVAFPFWWLVSIRIIRPDCPPWLATPVPAVTAYLVGSLIASATTSTPQVAGPHRLTVVASRSEDDYAPRWIRDLPWILISSSALVVIVLQLIRPSIVLGATATAAATLAGLLAAVSAGSAVREAGSSWLTGPVALFMTFAAQAFAFGLLVLVVRQEIWGYRRRHRPAAPSLETT